MLRGVSEVTSASEVSVGASLRFVSLDLFKSGELWERRI